MSDLISRQAAIGAIDKILPADLKNEYTKGKIVGVALAMKYVMQLPSAQPECTDEQIQKMQDMHQAEVEKAFELGMGDEKAEIVRCKDCKWYSGRERMCNDLMGFGRYWKSDDFCSYGKRRTDEL